MGAGTSKIPDLKNLSVDQLTELKDKTIPELIAAKQNKNDPDEKSSPIQGGKKRRKKTIKHRKKRMKKTGKK